MSVLLEEKLPVIPVPNNNKIEEKSCSCHKNYDELTGLKPGDSISSLQGVYDEMTGEAFILPLNQENYSDNLSSDIITRKASVSAKEAPIHVIYINGMNTNKVKYEQSLPLISNLLNETNIKGKYTLHNDTYNESGKFDLIQSMKQGLVPGNFNDVEGSNFDENVVKKIKALDEEARKKGKQDCEDDPRAKFLIISHSQGNFFAEEIYNKLPGNIKERTKILSISPFTDFKGIDNNNYEYLLRQDDFPNVLKKLPGIAVPKDKSNLPEWPGKPNGFPGDKNSHNIENYLDLNKYPEGSKKYKLVEKSFDKAKDGINQLMEPDSGFYNDVSVRKACPINNIEIKGPKEVAHHEYATFTVSYTNPKKEAKGIEIMGFDGLTIGAEWIKIPNNKLKSGKFQFQAYNEDFFGSVDAEKSFSASLISDPSAFSYYIATSDPVANVNFLGSGSGWSGLPAQAIPVHDENDNFWVKWLT